MRFSLSCIEDDQVILKLLKIQLGIIKFLEVLGIFQVQIYGRFVKFISNHFGQCVPCFLLKKASISDYMTSAYNRSSGLTSRKSQVHQVLYRPFFLACCRMETGDDNLRLSSLDSGPRFHGGEILSRD